MCWGENEKKWEAIRGKKVADLRRRRRSRLNFRWPWKEECQCQRHNPVPKCRLSLLHGHQSRLCYYKSSHSKEKEMAFWIQTVYTEGWGKKMAKHSCLEQALKGATSIKAIFSNMCVRTHTSNASNVQFLYTHTHSPLLASTIQLISWRLLPVALVVEEADEEEFLLWPVLHQLSDSEHVPWRSGYEHAFAMEAHSGHLWVYDLHKQVRSS